MPDFDVDFCKERRGEVIDYVVRKYGEDHVAQIISFGTMAARGAIRDVGRVLEIPYATVDSVAKLVPMEHDMTIEEALKLSPDLRSRCNNDPQIKKLLDVAMSIEGNAPPRYNARRRCCNHRQARQRLCSAVKK